MKKIKKYLASFLIILLLLHSSFFTVPVFADDPVVTDTPAPVQTTVDNSATVTNNTDSTANTGDNTVNPTPTDTVTPTPDPSQTITPTDTSTDTPSPTPTPIQSGFTLDPSPAPDVTTDNSASNSPDFNLTPTPGNNNVSLTSDGNIANNDNSTANTGGNNVTDTATYSSQLADPEVNSCQAPSADASISTGDAVSVTSTDNTVNSTQVNSVVNYQTINIFVDKNGDINLVDPFTIAANIIKDHPEDSVINVSAVNVNNYSYLSNNILSTANTGGNIINTDGSASQAIINTGNAYSIVSLLNKVNFVIVNSTVHVVSINVFGNLNGNIILPNMSPVSSCAGCGASLIASDTATVTNNVNSTANSGANTINGSGSITTGDATSVINNLNLVNTNLFGSSAEVLYINTFGNWNGNFIGWDGFSSEAGGASLVFYNTSPINNICSSCTVDANISNTAVINNNVSSFANSGGNNINANGKIQTGNAYSAVSLVNLINSNFINSLGFFGFINIFGNWTGDIGGQNEFNALAASTTPDNTSPIINSSTSDSTPVEESGGQLAVTSSNNVGAFVYPGDTVTFFVKVKNTGTGTVYSAKVDLFLVRDGQQTGGSTFNLGDIAPGKSKTLTTGFVLSKSAPAGLYTARADAYGNVGPDNSTVNASSENTFNVQTVFSPIVSAGSSNVVISAAVLGTHYPSLKKLGTTNSREDGLYVLLAVLMTYFILRGIRQRRELGDLWQNSTTFKEKITTLRMFLF